MTAIVKYPHGEAQLAAPAANMASGLIFDHAVLGACVKEGLSATNAIGDPISVRYAGLVEVVSASGTTFAAGAEVEIAESTQLAVAATAGDFDIGRAVIAKTSGQLSVLVELNVAGA